MFIEEIATQLQRQNVGVLGTTLFLSSQAQIPAGDGPYLSLSETGGTGAVRMHNSVTERPTLQILARGKKPSRTRAMIRAAYNALGGPIGLHNVYLSDVFYLSITARQEPAEIGADSNGRGMYSFNIDAEKQRS